MSGNLPPGVMDSDIPGNRPEDEKWEKVLDWIAETEITPRILQNLVLGWCKRSGQTWKEPPLK